MRNLESSACILSFSMHTITKEVSCHQSCIGPSMDFDSPCRWLKPTVLQLHTTQKPTPNEASNLVLNSEWDGAKDVLPLF